MSPVRCPNPRVILPRNIVPGVVNSPVTVDIRSFGVRTPPCTREEPSYGIIGMFHILPPALAWLWRLTSPRGYANPSIVESDGLTSEGVGSYWPFATCRRVDQANLLLEQILSTPETLFILCQTSISVHGRLVSCLNGLHGSTWLDEDTASLDRIR